MKENERIDIENYKNNLENKKKNFILNLTETTDISRCVKKKCNNILENETKKSKDQVETSINHSNFEFKIEEEKNKEIQNAIQDFSYKSKHINIIMLGKTGVGKSELINALAGSNIAQTGGFRPMRHIGKWHEIGSLKIYDNKGIEISKDNSISAIIKNIQNLIETSKTSGNPDKFVHCIWYCVTGTRFEQDEELAIGKLLEIYPDKSLPLIVVYLRAVCSEWGKNMKKGIEETFNREIEFIPVLSKDVVNDDGTVIKKFGLNSLISRTMYKIKNSIDSMSFIYVINFVQKKIQSIILNKNNNRFFVNENNSITDCVINFFNSIIGTLDPVA